MSWQQAGAAPADRAQRATGDDAGGHAKDPEAGGHTGGVSPFAGEGLAEGLRTPMRDPVCTAVFCGIDSMLAPVVDRADDAQAPGAVLRLEKGHSVRDLAGANWPQVALSGGSDVTGLDVSVPDGRLDSADTAPNRLNRAPAGPSGARPGHDPVLGVRMTLCVPKIPSMSHDLRVFVDDTAGQVSSAGSERVKVSDGFGQEFEVCGLSGGSGGAGARCGGSRTLAAAAEEVADSRSGCG